LWFAAASFRWQCLRRLAQSGGVSKASAQFFLDWVRERSRQIKLDDPRQRDEVLQHHRAAERFWQEKVAAATAD
jgi:hypothetical protein